MMRHMGCLRWCALASCIIFGAGSLRAAPADIKIGPATVAPDGVISIGGSKISVSHFDNDWAKSSQANLEVDAGFPKNSGGRMELQGKIRCKSSETPLSFQEKIERVGDGIQVGYDVSHGSLSTRTLAAELSLPVSNFAGRAVRIDERAITLPREFKDMGLVRVNQAKRVMIPTPDGYLQIDGDLNVYIQDERKWKADSYTMRLSFAPTASVLNSAALKLQLRVLPYDSTPVDIRGQANMGFRDEVADDGKGGWTDQGAENDLRALKPGDLKAAGVTFKILDPAINGGKSCMVFAGPERAYFLKSATVELPARPTWANVYLLHAAAWVPSDKVTVGQIVAQYADGTQQTMDVATGRDVANWWGPGDLANGYVGWSYNAPHTDIGLYVSKFALQNKPLQSLKFDATQKSVWMIAAVTGSPENIELPARQMKTIVAGPEWAPLEMASDIQPGSIFDFSALADAPAGKYGQLLATPQGHFEFASRPGVAAKFWGANLCFSANYLAKEQCDQLAERFVRSGYNTVRFHHYDRDLQSRDGKSYDLNPEQLDKLDYLFAAFKKRGVYVNIDLYTIRRFSKEEVPELGHDVVQEIKGLIPISDAAYTAWQKFAENLMKHVNPYTGMSWGNDPALIGICPVNEDTIFHQPDSDPALRRLYQEKFEQWVKAQGVDISTPTGKTSAYNRFLAELQEKADQRMHAFLKSLKVKALLTGVNYQDFPALTFIRSHYDYVDNHTYWDHPRFAEKKWSLPYVFHQSSSVQKFASVPRNLMAARLFGKPYTVTEFNFVWPNSYRAEGGVLMAAYAGLQDWDALYNFDYSARGANIWAPEPVGLFDLATDPIGLLADRAAAVMFRRGDIKPAKGGVAYVVEDRGSLGKFPDAFTYMGLLTRIGSLTPEQATAALAKQTGIRAWASAGGGETLREGLPNLTANDDLPAQLAKAGVIQKQPGDADVFISETGQMELRPREGIAKLVTDASECFVVPARKNVEGHAVRVANGEAYGAVYALSADGEPVAKTGRMLVLFLTDALSTGTKFVGQNNQMVLARGSLPHLVHRGDAVISIRRNSQRPVEVWAVSTDGARRKQLPATRDGQWMSFKAQTAGEAGVYLAYEIVEK